MPAFPTIARRADFEALSRSRISASCRLLVLRARETNDEVTRVGLSTPRGLGGAVKRNRLRRRLREAIRVRHAAIATGWDLL
ncbi:MAG: ribonuclease P protein component, partial [Gemmatimonadota bacterium]|nr:ribonuclease P protein component [Gemmatimonadota bacterium]